MYFFCWLTQRALEWTVMGFVCPKESTLHARPLETLLTLNVSGMLFLQIGTR